MSLYHWTHIFMSYLCVFKRSLLGVKIWLSHAQIGLLLESQKAWATPKWSPLGVKFKISHEHPRLFHMGVFNRYHISFHLGAIKAEEAVNTR